MKCSTCVYLLVSLSNSFLCIYSLVPLSASLRAAQDEYNTTLHLKHAASSTQRTDQRALAHRLETRLSSLEEDGKASRHMLHSLPLLESSNTSTPLHRPHSTSHQPHYSPREREREREREKLARASSTAMKRRSEQVTSPVLASRSRSPALEVQGGGGLSPTGSAGRERERRDRRRERSSSRDVKSQSPTRDTFRRSGSPTGRKGVSKRASARDVIAPFQDMSDSFRRLESSDALDEVRYTRCSPCVLLPRLSHHLSHHINIIASLFARPLSMPLRHKPTHYSLITIH